VDPVTKDTTYTYDKISYIDDILSQIRSQPGLDSSVLGQNSTDLLGAKIKQAYDQYLIDKGTATKELKSYLPLADFKQSGSQITTGRSLSYDFAGGFNWNNTLFFGAGASIISHSYKKTTTITEQFSNVPLVGNQNDPSNKLYERAFYTLINNYYFSGTGFNFRLGIIALPVPNVRVGLSFQSPTWNSITQNYDNSLQASYNGAPYGVNFTLPNGDPYYINNVPSYTYNVTTPAKLSLGTALFFRSGFITLDGDYMDYSGAKVYDPTSAALDADNRYVKNVYQSVVNVRLGGECRFNSFYLRAGLGVYGNPYTSAYLNALGDSTQHKINAYNASASVNGSLGIGYRTEDYYWDFTVVNRNSKLGFVSHGYTPVADTKLSNTSIVFTIGFPFN
jgi:hypothetical protein